MPLWMHMPASRKIVRKMPEKLATRPKMRSNEGRVLLKSCPRCQGARRIERDPFGWYLMCFSCGYTTYPSVKPAGIGAQRKSA